MLLANELFGQYRANSRARQLRLSRAIEPTHALHHTSMPKVTYLVPTNRVDRFLRCALQSIDDDTYKDKSIVLVDNTMGEADAVELFVEQLGLRTPIQVVHCTAAGVSQALNAGLRVISSEYVARMDADDLVAPNRTTLQVDSLECAPQYVGLGSSASVINSLGVHIGRLSMPRISSIPEMRNSLRVENPYIHPSVMIRTKVLQEFGYSEWAVNCQDWDLWIRLALQGKLLGNLPARLLSYRQHPEQISVNKGKDENAHALRRALETLEPSYQGRYLFQRNYLEHRRPTFFETAQILVAELPKIRSIFAARKLAASLLRVYG